MKSLFFIFIASFIFLTHSPAFASEKRYVIDDMGVLTESQHEVLNDHAWKISKKHRHHVYFFLSDYIPNVLMATCGKSNQLVINCFF